MNQDGTALFATLAARKMREELQKKNMDFEGHTQYQYMIAFFKYFSDHTSQHGLLLRKQALDRVVNEQLQKHFNGEKMVSPHQMIEMIQKSLDSQANDSSRPSKV